LQNLDATIGRNEELKKEREFDVSRRQSAIVDGEFSGVQEIGSRGSSARIATGSRFGIRPEMITVLSGATARAGAGEGKEVY